MKSAIANRMSHSRGVLRNASFSSKPSAESGGTRRVRSYVACLALPLIVGFAACNRGGTDLADRELGGGDGDAPVPVGRDESASERALTDAGSAMGSPTTVSPGTTGLNDTNAATGSGGGTNRAGGTASGAGGMTGGSGTTSTAGAVGTGGATGRGGTTSTGGTAGTGGTGTRSGGSTGTATGGRSGTSQSSGNAAGGTASR